MWKRQRWEEHEHRQAEDYYIDLFFTLVVITLSGLYALSSLRRGSKPGYAGAAITGSAQFSWPWISVTDRLAVGISVNIISWCGLSSRLSTHVICLPQRLLSRNHFVYTAGVRSTLSQISLIGGSVKSQYATVEGRMMGCIPFPRENSCYVKCKHLCPGFDLWSPIYFATT